jgi:hypothetical protein
MSFYGNEWVRRFVSSSHSKFSELCFSSGFSVDIKIIALNNSEAGECMRQTRFIQTFFNLFGSCFHFDCARLRDKSRQRNELAYEP